MTLFVQLIATYVIFALTIWATLWAKHVRIERSDWKFIILLPFPYLLLMVAVWK